MEPPAALLAFAPPSETALLDFVRTKVSREMIHEIALNDYERDIPLHELGILQQLTPDPDLGLLPWHPREVLELERWNEPDEGDADQAPTGIAGHRKRLFACTILLRNVAFVVRHDSWDGEAEFFIAISAVTVIQLVRGSISLGSQTSRLALGFLLWLHGMQSHPMLRPFAALGALILAIQEDCSGVHLRETCEWIEQEECWSREHLGEDVHSQKWLLGINYQEDSDLSAQESRERWINALSQVITASSEYLSADAARTTRRILDRMSA